MKSTAAVLIAFLGVLGAPFAHSADSVTYVRIDSAQHYRALEHEVREMLRQAGPQPAPFAQVPVNKIGWNIPVEFHLVLTSSLARCAAPANPGPVPSGPTATLQQMSVYRERLKGYLAASSQELDCLARAPDATAQADRSSLTQQLHALVDAFNAQLRVFETKAQATALAEERQAQQANQRQLRAVAAQVYSGCTSPAAPPAPAALTANTAESYGRSLVSYQDAVRAYIACIREAHRVATAPERKVASDQRAQLDQTGAQLGDAAIQSLNQLVAEFNAQVPRLRQQITAQTQQDLAEALVRASRIFPNSTWDVPAPLPKSECFRIMQSGQTYQAQVCQSTYVPFFGDPPVATGLNGGPGDAGIALATVQERIAASHGVAGDPRGGGFILGIAPAPSSQADFPTGTTTRQRTIYYSVSELHVTGRRVSMTITRRVDPGGDSSNMHFDLVLSPDNQTLRGYCWTGNQRSACTLTRHVLASTSRDSRQ